jgi:hypothetical protein
MTSSLREAESRRAPARMRTESRLGVWGKKAKRAAGELPLTCCARTRFYLQVAHERLKIGLIEALGDVCCARFCATPTIDTSDAFGGAELRTYEPQQQGDLVRFLLDLLESLDSSDNSRSSSQAANYDAYSDDLCVGTIITTLGRVATAGPLQEPALRTRLWKDVLHQLYRDQLFPTRHGFVGSCALVALARIERWQLQAAPPLPPQELLD